MATITVERTVDGTGKTITTFVVYEAAAALRGMAEGEVLEVLTDDYEAFEPDIDTWCQATGQVLLGVERVDGGLRFLIEKRTPKTKETSLAMVISPDGLEELLSPLGFALAAALEGIEVSLYLQGPATRVVTRKYRPRLKGWARPFSRFAAAGMADSGHIPAQEKLRQLRTLGATIYLCAGSMDHFKVKREDLIFDDLPIVEYLTFTSVMEDADAQVYI